MPDFQRLTKLIVKHALGYFDIAPLALNPERRSYKCPNSRRGRGRPRHNVGWASSPVMRGRTCRPKLASSATHPRRTKFPSPEAAQAIGHGRLILNSIRSDLEALR